MKTLTTMTLVALTASTLAGLPAAAYAADSTPEPKGGTLKGAAVGGVAGHMMGGHTKTGAAVGAAAGHHEKAKSEDRINAGKPP
jgi:hypothetical protein